MSIYVSTTVCTAMYALHSNYKKHKGQHVQIAVDKGQNTFINNSICNRITFVRAMHSQNHHNESHLRIVYQGHNNTMEQLMQITMGRYNQYIYYSIVILSVFLSDRHLCNHHKEGYLPIASQGQCTTRGPHIQIAVDKRQSTFMDNSTAIALNHLSESNHYIFEQHFKDSRTSGGLQPVKSSYQYMKYLMEISQVFCKVDIHVYKSASYKMNFLYTSQCIRTQEHYCRVL